MLITVVKNDKESNERCLTRWLRRVQAGRKSVLLRAKRYYSKPLTKRLVRMKALKREGYRAVREKNKFR